MKLITIAGIIGIGKSTLLKHIEGYIIKHNLQNKYITIPELIPKSLPNFYVEVLQNKKPCIAYEMQMQLLVLRFNQLLYILQEHKGKTFICDGGLWLDQCYAINLFKFGYIAKYELDVYTTLIKAMKKKLFANFNSNKCIYLQNNKTDHIKNILNRGRNGEQFIDINYLIGLDNTIVELINIELINNKKNNFYVSYVFDYNYKNKKEILKLIQQEIVNE